MNLVITNLLVSDLSIIFIGIPLDAIGAFTKGQALNNVLCPIVAFTHTFSGMANSIFTFRRLLFISIWSLLILKINIFIWKRYELFIHDHSIGCNTMHICDSVWPDVVRSNTGKIYNIEICPANLGVFTHTCLASGNGYWRIRTWHRND